jgi:SAM-dependent methyltransferase
MTIDYFSLGHPLAGLRSHYALRARRNMFDQFMAFAKPTGSSRVLDLGVTPDASLPESNVFERWYPYPDQLTAASIEDARDIENCFSGVRFTKLEPGKKLPFADGYFHALYCSAVLEHVGDGDAQRQFVAEALRVTRYFFFSTPNRWFPVDFHTFVPFAHWLPRRAHQAILRGIGKTFWAKTENLNLLSPGRIRDLFPNCRSLQVKTIHLFGIPSNILVFGEA